MEGSFGSTKVLIETSHVQIIHGWIYLSMEGKCFYVLVKEIDRCSSCKGNQELLKLLLPISSDCIFLLEKEAQRSIEVGEYSNRFISGGDIRALKGG